MKPARLDALQLSVASPCQASDERLLTGATRVRAAHIVAVSRIPGFRLLKDQVDCLVGTTISHHELPCPKPGPPPGNAGKSPTVHVASPPDQNASIPPFQLSGCPEALFDFKVSVRILSRGPMARAFIGTSSSSRRTTSRATRQLWWGFPNPRAIIGQRNRQSPGNAPD